MEKLKEIRSRMEKEGVDYYIIPTGDPHGSEYPADAYKYRTFVTGFTGSAGTAVISQEEAYLWTDGRYYIQAGRELEGSGFQLMKLGEPGVLAPLDWLEKKAQEGENVAFHGKIFMAKDFLKLEGKRKDLNYKSLDLVGDLWKDRPALPKGKIFSLKSAYTKLTSEEKIGKVREDLKDRNLDLFLLSSLDDIAWLTNLRGKDIECNPVFLSFMVISQEAQTLYVDSDKVNRELLTYLEGQKIGVKAYEEIYKDLEKIKDQKILLDPEKTNVDLYLALREKNRLTEDMNPTTFFKAKKNEVELNNQKTAYMDDGVALVKYFAWLDREVKAKKITEFQAQEKLVSFRKRIIDYVEDSFTPISAYGENGAMMHYSAQKGKDAVLGEDSFYLIDSGGQYYRGTTDITRTLHFGEPTDEEKRDYTLVLKSHINLAMTVFLEGTKGSQLDAIARRPLWQHHLDYKCGTGHGVGYFLNVHEGPHRISRWTKDVPLKEGYLVTIEPGIYKEGKYGIRLENVVAVKEDGKSPDGTFYSFDMLSYIPFDRKCIDRNLLNNDEIQWLNKYHEQVYNLLSPNLSPEEESYLSKQTEPIRDHND